MSRPPSTETLLRRAKNDMRMLKADLSRAESGLAIQRGRATKAEQECAEWKARFDLLLRREGKEQTT